MFTITAGTHVGIIFLKGDDTAVGHGGGVCADDAEGPLKSGAVAADLPHAPELVPGRLKKFPHVSGGFLVSRYHLKDTFFIRPFKKIPGGLEKSFPYGKPFLKRRARPAAFPPD
jgi:hypothetical protein